MNFVACDLSHRDTVLHNQWCQSLVALRLDAVQLWRRTVDVLSSVWLRTKYIAFAPVSTLCTFAVMHIINLASCDSPEDQYD